MENIRQAVERAKGRPEQGSGIGVNLPRQQGTHGFANVLGGDARLEETELESANLQSKRLIAYDGKDPRSRPFDMLRTQVLRSMDQKGWKILAVTSPTPGCGKTLTAVNLALSIARQLERQVLLVDMDMRKPQVASCLGLKFGRGLLDVLEGHAALTSEIIHARIGNCKFEVLPTAPTLHSSDLMGSSAMSAMLQDVRIQGQSRIAILDLPPLLTGNDVIAIQSEVDCVLLVAAVGVSTVSEIEECSRHIQSIEVVQFVLNKVPESSTNYHYY